MDPLAALYGLFSSYTAAATLGVIVAALVLGYTGASFWLWMGLAALTLFGFGVPLWLWIFPVAFAVLVGVLPVRRVLVSANLLKIVRSLNLLPAISETERTAIEAGNVWVDAELFSGKPDFKRILNEPYPDLTKEEQEFLDGPADEVCRMTNDWEVFRKKDLPPEVWAYLKKERFFALIIPKKYGGHGFSVSANSAVVAKLMSRCGPLGTTVMVPNSLGPAELLLHYGTAEQKNYYLPRLASGEEIPCFALTEPAAGSDAGAIASRGVVFNGEDGKLYLRLNWKKRYITLAPVSTLLGLAFKLLDPENLLGRGEEPGITCALIPTSTAGVVIGRRHDPLGLPFYNGPTEGHDVVVPVEAIIGGAKQAGNGWRMLMESLAVGRGISLPASATGGTRKVARILGAYAKVRQQFGLPIGKFEGIEEPLARSGGYAYILEAARRFTCGGLDSGQKPAVITAIAKYNFTEILRSVVNDGMDVLGGAGISLGPRNLLGHGYYGVPINITVEGANILTRTLIIFGQGAIRCHPYAYQEINALMNDDLATFDRAFWKHLGHVVRNKSRSILLSLTRGYLAGSPVKGPTAKYYRKMAWASASFAFLSDLAMGRYGGNLKRLEKLTGRFADILSWMYLGVAVLRRFEAEGRKTEDLPFVHWSMQLTFNRIQLAFEGIFQNMGFPFRGLVSWWSRVNPLSRQPSDQLGSKIARILQTPGPQRDDLTRGTYVSKNNEEASGRLENAFLLVSQAEPVVKRVKNAVRAGQLEKARIDLLLPKAVEAGIINAREAELLKQAEEARTDAIQVDSFTQKEYRNGAPDYSTSGKTTAEPTLSS